MYKSLTAQTLHYFARPHSAVCAKPFAGRAAWRGAEMAGRTDWRVELDLDEKRELDAAVRAAKATGKPLKTLRARDFPLPTLARRIAEWGDEIRDGRGFVLLRGVPLERWDDAGAESFFWGFGLHLGVPGAQNPAGDLLGHVTDEGPRKDPLTVRAYRTAGNISYHCDAADAVGLLCLQKAKLGGASRIVSSVSVYNELLARRPDLVDRLYSPFSLDTRGEGGVDHFPIPPCRYAYGRLRTFWHSDYFRSSQSHADAPRVDARGRELLDLYDEIASSKSLYLDMDFEPGDVQLLSNHTILHARTAYEDHEDPTRKRHLLRLWISLHAPRSLGERAATARSLVGLVATLARVKLERRLQLGGQRAVS